MYVQTKETLFGKMFNQEDVIVAAACTIILSSIKKKRKRFWVRPSLQRRQTINGTNMLNDFNHDDMDPLSGELRYINTLIIYFFRHLPVYLVMYSVQNNLCNLVCMDQIIVKKVNGN